MEHQTASSWVDERMAESNGYGVSGEPGIDWKLDSLHSLRSQLSHEVTSGVGQARHPERR